MLTTAYDAMDMERTQRHAARLEMEHQRLRDLHDATECFSEVAMHGVTHITAERRIFDDFIVTEFRFHRGDAGHLTLNTYSKVPLQLDCLPDNYDNCKGAKQ